MTDEESVFILLVLFLLCPFALLIVGLGILLWGAA